MSALPVALDVRSAASRFPSGVALVTAPGGDALVVDSFVSVSLDPPLISFSPARASLTWHRMRRAGRFGVNVLGVAHGSDLRERARPGADRLAGLDVRRTAGGVARVMDARAFFECVLEAEHAAGDHTIVVGRVIAVHDGAGEPLVFADGAFGRVAPLSTAPRSA